MKKGYLGIVLLLSMVLLAGCNALKATSTTETEATETAAETETTSGAEATREAETAAATETAAAAGTETEAEAAADVNAKAAVGTEAEAGSEAKTGTKTETMDFTVNSFDTPKEMYVISAVNVRKGPSTKYDILSHLAGGSAVTVYGQADTGWYQVKIGEAYGYTSHNYLSDTPVQAPAPAPAQQTAAQQTTPQATAAPAGVIMVGDSRCVQMQTAVGGGGCSWVCENSKEYTWFVEKAIPRLDPYVGNGTKVVINMGVNDPEHYKQYVETINAMAAQWSARGAKTYLVSVNPVWENPYTSQEQVDTFNANVPGMLSGVTWIDTASWLNTNGCKILDGLHYDDATYVNIFNLIMGSL